MKKGAVVSLLTVISLYLVLGAGVCRAGVFEFKGKGADGANFIRLQYQAIDTRAGEPLLPVTMTVKGYPARVSGYYIIQFTGPVQESWKEELKAKGVKFFGYLPENSFMVKMTGASAEQVKGAPNVRWVGVYQPAYKISKKVMARISAGPLSTLGVKNYDVKVFDGEDLTPIKDGIESMGGMVEVVADNEGLNGKLLRVEVVETKVEDISRMTEVEWVEEYVPPTIQNDVAVGPSLMNVTPVWTDATNPLTGTGQVVAVMDTGLDTGNTATIHPAFAGTAGNGQAKVKQAFGYARPGDWTDPNGHGTHTSGSVTGKPVSGYSVKGMAYNAQLVFQSVLPPDGTPGLLIPDLNSTGFADAYNAGARVHSDSWGSAVSGDYTTTCVSADTYIWNHKDFVAVFSAGNEGTDGDSNGLVDLGSIGSPGTAKNVVTVGASENYRPTITPTFGGWWPSDFPVAPIFGDTMANNPNGMVAFSSRGPCKDGRRKPDVVAPGSWVLSTKSTLAPDSAYWGKPSAAGYPASYDTYFRFDGGTSMACPLTAGTCALIRQFYTDVKGVGAPSAALIKATLISGARDMTPGQYGAGATQDVSGWPDNSQGWGRVNLDDSVFPNTPSGVAYVDASPGVSTGAAANHTFTVNNTTVPVRVTLAWSDYPGSTSATTQLVNDLDLKVTAPDGTIYHGNLFTGGYSNPNPAEIPDTYDGLENVEVVQIPASALTSGTLAVNVKGYNVPQGGSQPYAVVVRGGVSAGGGGCTYSLDHPSDAIAIGGGTGSVGVTAGATCGWTAVSNNSYIHVTGGASGTGNGTVTYSVDANAGAARSGTMTVAGRTFTVNQSGTTPCVYNINHSSDNFGAGGGSSTVGVTTGGGCGWTAASNDSWMHVTGGAGGSGNGTVSFTVDANSGGAGRTGTMTIAGNTFTVSEDGANFDNCSSAKTIASLPYTNLDTNAAATSDPSDPDTLCGGLTTGVGHTVWYRYTPAQDDRIILDTFGSLFDTVLSVFTGSCGALTEVACADDYGRSVLSEATVSVTAGTTYSVMVSSFSTTGGGTLRLNARQGVFISSLSSASGYWGQLITARGRNFGALKGSVYVGSDLLGYRKAKVIGWTNTGVVFAVPTRMAPGAYKVYVLTKARPARTSNKVNLTVTLP